MQGEGYSVSHFFDAERPACRNRHTLTAFAPAPSSPATGARMIFEQIATGGCQSYLIGCADTCAAALIDPEISQDRSLPGARRAPRPAHPLRDRHAHPRRPLLRHAASWPPPRRADRDAPGQPGALRRHARRRRRARRAGEAAHAGASHAGPHARFDVPAGRGPRLTGDTLLIGGTGRTDLPTGDPEALYDSLFNKLLQLDPALQGLSGARLQGPQPLDASATEIADESAPAEARPRRVRRDDAQPEPLRCPRTSPRRCAPT